MSWVITGSEKNPVDLFRSQVSLLLHGDGANGSTTITDNSPTPKTVTAVGNAQISTVQSKFGGSSIELDGTGDYALIPSNLAFQFGSGNFTIEAWAYPRSFGDYKAIVSNMQLGETSWAFTFMSNGVLRFQTYNASIASTSSNAVTLNEWSHVAVTRINNNFTVFVNGTQQGTGTVTNAFSLLSNVSVGGDLITANYFNGYIDDLRITKGIARYTTNFTPPTAPFPDI
jgi:hypothetical protein